MNVSGMNVNALRHRLNVLGKIGQQIPYQQSPRQRKTKSKATKERTVMGRKQTRLTVLSVLYLSLSPSRATGPTSDSCSSRKFVWPIANPTRRPVPLAYLLNTA